MYKNNTNFQFDCQAISKIFRETFAGRGDVVPEHWKSKRDKKAGYTPLCKNKWDSELCNLKKKSRKGCRDCENADYIPLSDELIKDHLAGKRILGTYPLLTDHTCHFIAADFDKHKPEDPDPLAEVQKYVEACEVQEIPCYVMRSKSGNGFHVYLFFTGPVQAWKARAVAFALLKEAGVIGDEAELSSFDKFIPSQGELSGKRFGNLISMPFQGKASKNGHTLFLDPAEDFQKPFEDQESILRNLSKVDESALNALIDEWSLKKEEPQRQGADFEPIKEDAPLAVFSRIKNGCKFIKHCCDDAEKLPEPEWYAFLTIVGRCKDGRRQAHKYGEDHPAYSREDTDSKLEHALNDTGPYRCETIKDQINDKYCKNCPSSGKIPSPITLGHHVVNDDTYIKAIQEINKKHAVIMVGGKCHVLNEVIEPVFNRPDITLSAPADFRNFYANKKLPDPNNSNKQVSVANFWFESPDRREFTEIVFDPSGDAPATAYNLWKGLAYEPAQGDWSLFRNHIYNIIANGNRKIFDWVVAWLARIVQDPGGEKPGTAIVLRGRQGTGKGIFVNTFGKLLGKHFIQIAQSNQVTGRFNHHLKDVLLAFVDEGFWAGDKQAEGALKNLVTEHFSTIEQKGKDIIRVKNNVNLILASNNDWVVPAGLEERRFFVLDIPDTKLQDHAYFRAIVNQMESGGLEAMLHDMLEIDISGVDLRTFEQTQGLFEQKLYSMSTVQKYWFERLCEGTLVSGRSEDFDQYAGTPLWKDGISTGDQYDDYLSFAENLRDRFPLCEQQFGLALQKMCKDAKKTRQRTGKKRIHKRFFPPLEECRKEFEGLTKIKIEWEEVEDEPLPF